MIFLFWSASKMTNGHILLNYNHFPSNINKMISIQKLLVDYSFSYSPIPLFKFLQFKNDFFQLRNYRAQNFKDFIDSFRHISDRNSLWQVFFWYIPLFCSWSTNTCLPLFLIFYFFLLFSPGCSNPTGFYPNLFPNTVWGTYPVGPYLNPLS